MEKTRLDEWYFPLHLSAYLIMGMHAITITVSKVNLNYNIQQVLYNSYNVLQVLLQY